MTVAGAAWFVGGFRWLDLVPLASVAGAMSLVYAGVAAHAIQTLPTGRATYLPSIATVVAAYATALVPPPVGPILIACALLAGLAINRREAVLDGPSQRRPTLFIGLVFAAALVASQVLPVTVPGGGRFDFRLVNQVGLMIAAAGSTATLLRMSERRARVTDLVVDLDPSRGGLARELAQAIGDPTLEVGYWLQEQGRFADLTGRAVRMPNADDGRGTTIIERDGNPVAVLIHDLTVSADPAVRAATRRAAELGTVNARLQAAAHERAAAVDASRRRLLRVADEERRELDLRLRDGVEPTLDELEAEIKVAASEANDPDGLLDGVLGQLAATRLDLAGIIENLHPADSSMNAACVGPSGP